MSKICKHILLWNIFIKKYKKIAKIKKGFVTFYRILIIYKDTVVYYVYTKCQSGVVFPLIMKEEIIMVQILAGEKGEGKTKRLIEMANEAIKASNGHVVYLDDDNRHIYDLHYDIRFVEVKEFPIVNYRELVGFIYGILSQDSDIEKIFIDGIYKIVAKLDNDDLIKLVAKLKEMSEKYHIDFIISANVNPAELPAEISDVLIS